MAKRVSMKHKRRAAPEWVFPWRGVRQSPLPKILAVLVTGLGFAVLLTSVRIQVAAPVPWASRKAAVIQVLDDADGRALTFQAREGGPFPSRFEPSEWEWAVATAREAYQAARWRPEPYAPVLRELPDPDAARPLNLAARGEPVLPDRRALARVARPMELPVLVPVLYPLAGITADLLPRDLPPFDLPVDAAMAAEPWRFLLRLNAAGGVIDCVSLSGGEVAGAATLAGWLRRISFPPEPATPDRWIAVGLGFSNQPADGPAAR
jgi:hypothetical protein